MKPFFLFVLISLFAFASCKVKTRDELIVGTWKIDVEATKKALPPGKETHLLDDSRNAEIRFIFYKDLTAQMQKTGPGDMKDTKSASYKLVHDGKYLNIMEEGRSKSDETEIVDLTETTMKLRIPDSTIVIFARVKS